MVEDSLQPKALAHKALTNSKSSIKSKLIDVSQDDQYKKYSVFEALQNGSKQKSVSYIYDIKNACSEIMANGLMFPLMYSVDRIRQCHFMHLISKFSKHSSPMLL